MTRTAAIEDSRLSYLVGGTWFCPGCATLMEERDGRLSCPVCGSCLNRFVHALVEIYIHPDVPPLLESSGSNPLLRAAMYGETEVARAISNHSPALRSGRGANGESAPELALAAGHFGTAVALFRANSPALPHDRDPTALLEALMCELSESVAFAGWLDELEHLLWHVIHSTEPLPERIDPFGFAKLPRALRDDLSWLSSLCDGWCRYGEARPEFISIAAWNAIHDEWVSSLKA